MTIADRQVDLRRAEIHRIVGRVELQIDVRMFRLKSPHPGQHPLGRERGRRRNPDDGSLTRRVEPRDGRGEVVEADAKHGIENIGRRREHDLTDATLEQRNAKVRL